MGGFAAMVPHIQRSQHRLTGPTPCWGRWWCRASSAAPCDPLLQCALVPQAHVDAWSITDLAWRPGGQQRCFASCSNDSRFNYDEDPTVKLWDCSDGALTSIATLQVAV